MDGTRWEILVRIMGRLAAGDAAAVFTLYTDFGPPIAAAVRRMGASMGTALDAEEVDGLVLEACLALMESAPSWDPDGGALPWNWAERRLRHIVAVHIGVYADSLDERIDAGADVAGDDVEPGDAERSGLDDDPVRTLETLAEHDPRAAEFAAALADVATPRDRRIFLEVRLQVSMGDRAPADTVARLVGMKPATVRQVVKRVRDRLAARGVAVAA